MTADDIETIRRIADTRDVLKAIAAAARLLDDQIELIEADMLDLIRRVDERERQP